MSFVPGSLPEKAKNGDVSKRLWALGFLNFSGRQTATKLRLLILDRLRNVLSNERGSALSRQREWN